MLQQDCVSVDDFAFVPFFYFFPPPFFLIMDMETISDVLLMVSAPVCGKIKNSSHNKPQGRSGNPIYERIRAFQRSHDVSVQPL